MVSSELGRNRLLVGGVAAAIGLVVVLGPRATEAVIGRFGVRPAAGVLLGLVLVSAVAAAPGRRFGAVRLGFAAVLATGGVTGAARALFLLPALVHLSLAAFCLASLRADDSLIERAVRTLVPEAPDFIRPYCRKVTALWVGFFAASAAVIAWLALFAPAAAWRSFSGGTVYVLMLAVTVVEFCVRKTWFRYYFHGGLVDRAWSRLFPAENTPEGRRSAAWIRRVRARRAVAAAPRRSEVPARPGEA